MVEPKRLRSFSRSASPTLASSSGRTPASPWTACAGRADLDVVAAGEAQLLLLLVTHQGT